MKNCAVLHYTIYKERVLQLQRCCRHKTSARSIMRLNFPLLNPSEEARTNQDVNIRNNYQVSIFSAALTVLAEVQAVTEWTILGLG